MATKYTIAETAHTEESDTFSSKAKAVEAADAAAEEYPGTPFRVLTGKGTVVHTAFAESVDVVDEDPADEVPEVQVTDEEEDAEQDQSFAEVLSETMGVPVLDATDVDEDFEEEDPATDVDDDFEPETQEAGQVEEDGEADPGHGMEVVSTEQAVALLAQAESGDEDAAGDGTASAQDIATALAPGGPGVRALMEQAPAAPVAAQPAPAGAELELCAANTNAKRMHYRAIGEDPSACGSSKTTRRANAHQVQTASMCTACEKLADGKVVDTRPAGTARGGSGSRKAPKTLVLDAGEIRDIVGHLKRGEAYELELSDGTRVMVVAGDPATGEVSDDLGDIKSINVVAS
jgi:hypothetical protein